MTVYTITLTVKGGAQELAKKIELLWPKQILASAVGGPYEVSKIVKSNDKN